MTPKAVYRPSLERLAAALGTELPTVADWRSIPRGLVLDLADFFEVEVEKGTAEEQLAEVLDEAGLMDDSGNPLSFSAGSSADLASTLARIIVNRKAQQQHVVRKTRPSTLLAGTDPEAWANTKLVAVNEISALTNSGPETIGPGSKERKSVLENLHRGLGFGEPPQMTKTDLATFLAGKMSVHEWGRDCTSTGETITLRGLNLLLAAARKRLENQAPGNLSIEAEADRYAGAILQTFVEDGAVDKKSYDVVWDGYEAVQRMIDAGYSNARQTEWPGWYFEFRGIPALKKNFKGGPERVGGTVFDYRGQRLWDLKAHSHIPGTPHKDAPLNDKESIQSAVRLEGLGFIMLSGEPGFEGEQEFYEWHMTEVRHRTLTERSENSRSLKSSFRPNMIEFFYFENEEELTRAECENILAVFAQGRQASGAPRKHKYNLKVEQALTDGKIHVHSVNIQNHFAAVADE